MVKSILSIIAFVAVLNVFAQDIRFEAVNKMPAMINTPCEEVLPMQSPDGKTLYFVRASCDVNNGGKTAGSDIWVSEINGNTGEWSRPTNTGIISNDKSHNSIVGISADGNTIYQLNTSPSKKIRGIYVLKKTNDKWSQPQLEVIPSIETEEFLGMHVSPNMRTILLSMKRADGSGEEDLYVIRKGVAGEWTKPLNLGHTINTIGFEISPFLSDDTKRLYFASNGHRGLGGSDIFYSDRLDDTWTSWSTPVNLGNVINTEGFDAYFTMRGDDVWFVSSSGISADIYRAKVQKPVDPTIIARNSLVAEASSMLDDLTDDTYDSLNNYNQSVYVTFEPGTAVLSKSALSQLDDAVNLITTRKRGHLSLVAYANSSGGESGQLWDKRLEEVRSYLRKKSGLDLMIDHEIVRVGMNESARKGSVVEVRYN